MKKNNKKIITSLGAATIGGTIAAASIAQSCGNGSLLPNAETVGIITNATRAVFSSSGVRNFNGDATNLNTNSQNVLRAIESFGEGSGTVSSISNFSVIAINVRSTSRVDVTLNNFSAIKTNGDYLWQTSTAISNQQIVFSIDLQVALTEEGVATEASLLSQNFSARNLSLITPSDDLHTVITSVGSFTSRQGTPMPNAVLFSALNLGTTNVDSSSIVFRDDSYYDDATQITITKQQDTYTIVFASNFTGKVSTTGGGFVYFGQTETIGSPFGQLQMNVSGNTISNVTWNNVLDTTTRVTSLITNNFISSDETSTDSIDNYIHGATTPSTDVEFYLAGLSQELSAGANPLSFIENQGILRIRTSRAGAINNRITEEDYNVFSSYFESPSSAMLNDQQFDIVFTSDVEAFGTVVAAEPEGGSGLFTNNIYGFRSNSNLVSVSGISSSPSARALTAPAWEGIMVQNEIQVIRATINSLSGQNSLASNELVMLLNRAIQARVGFENNSITSIDVFNLSLGNIYITNTDSTNFSESGISSYSIILGANTATSTGSSNQLSITTNNSDNTNEAVFTSSQSAPPGIFIDGLTFLNGTINWGDVPAGSVTGLVAPA